MTAIGEVLRYDHNYNTEVPVVDGYPNFWFLQKAPQFEHKNLLAEAGINRVMLLKAVDALRTPVITLRSSPWKAGQETTPWHDEFHLDRGHVRYFGDHRVTTVEPVGSTRGNAALLEAWRLHASGDMQDRLLAPPLLVFRSSPQTVDGVLKPKGYMEFCGVGVMEDLDLLVQRDPRRGGTFPNFVIDVNIIELPDDEFDWRWIDDRRSPELSAEESLRYAPDSWRNWVERGRTVFPGIRRRVVTSEVQKSDEQAPQPGSTDAALLRAIHVDFENDKAGFDRLAARLAERALSRNGTRTTAGWLTGTGVRGGMDFVGRLEMGTASASTPLGILGRAECVEPGDEISADQVARVVARLRRGWIGVFVTTGIFSEQAQVEVVDDEYPIILVNGKVLIEMVRLLAEESHGGDVEVFLSSFRGEGPDALASTGTI